MTYYFTLNRLEVQYRSPCAGVNVQAKLYSFLGVWWGESISLPFSASRALLHSLAGSPILAFSKLATIDSQLNPSPNHSGLLF